MNVGPFRFPLASHRNGNRKPFQVVHFVSYTISNSLFRPNVPDNWRRLHANDRGKCAAGAELSNVLDSFRLETNARLRRSARAMVWF